MDEAVQLPPNLLMRFKKAAEAVEKATSVRVISHNDADGICSASIICSMLFRKCKQFQCSMVKGFDENFVRGSVEGHDLLIISDMGSNNLDVLESLGIAVVVLDHHKPERDSDRTVHCNPHIFGIDGATEGCASSLALLLAVTVSESNWDLSGASFGGIVGDRQHLRGMAGINAYLLQGASKRKMIEERPGQIITDGPLRDALYATTEPFIVGVSGDRQGVDRLLADARVLDNLPYDSLEEEEKVRLNSLIVLRLLEQGVGLANLEELLSNRYYSPDRKVYSKDVANAVNACGKSENQGVGLAMLMGDVKASERAWKLKDEFQKQLLANCIAVNDRGLLHAENFQYFVSPDIDVSSETCGTMMQWVGDQTKPTVSLAHKGGEVRISSRANRHIVDHLGIDLGAALKEATAKVGGSGGGHNIASGGRIPLGKEDAFLKELDRALGEQKREKTYAAK
ncbi:MAG: DHH family phosphoesterase [Methanomassiliicoccales archaeon]|nr:MAG: DHH family phosphoesterase [Methanomassiliicoccales archaeon]